MDEWDFTAWPFGEGNESWNGVACAFLTVAIATAIAWLIR